MQLPTKHGIIPNKTLTIQIIWKYFQSKTPTTSFLKPTTKIRIIQHSIQLYLYDLNLNSWNNINKIIMLNYKKEGIQILQSCSNPTCQTNLTCTVPVESWIQGYSRCSDKKPIHQKKPPRTKGWSEMKSKIQFNFFS